MKSDSLQKEQKAKKKAALNEYLEEKKELEYWIKRVEELEKINQYRSPLAATVPSGNGPGDPTAMAIMELETAFLRSLKWHRRQTSGCCLCGDTLTA